MAKLTKAQSKAHQEACKLVALDRDLTDDEREYVLDNWQESATNINNLAGAYFTPAKLARDFSIEVPSSRIIDLCAGVGRLAHACIDAWGRRDREFVCVEKNPAYVEVGRKILPEATWICGDVLDVPGMGLGRFDCAISNPPFGRINRGGKTAPRYRGGEFEYHVIDIAAHLADYGVFIVPQMSAPFRYSGQPYYQEQKTQALARFRKDTGIELGGNCGIDTSYYRGDWRGVAPAVEIVCADFAEAGAGVIAAGPVQPDLFGEVA